MWDVFPGSSTCCPFPFQSAWSQKCDIERPWMIRVYLRLANSVLKVRVFVEWTTTSVQIHSRFTFWCTITNKCGIYKQKLWLFYTFSHAALCSRPGNCPDQWIGCLEHNAKILPSECIAIGKRNECMKSQVSYEFLASKCNCFNLNFSWKNLMMSVDI